MSAPPKHLGTAGCEFWRSFRTQFESDNAADLTLLTHACECLDRMAAARDAISEHGVITLDRYKQPRVSPACELERRAKGQFLAIIKQLGIEDGEHVDRRYQHSKHKSRRR